MKLILPRSAQKELDSLEDNVVLRISQKLAKLAQDPYGSDSHKLTGNNNYRIRIGVYRVVYSIDKTSQTITIIKIAHRREVYR
ncbi:MAG: type II toxin-antitoxin system RelE/ParE family toxin [Patescibacteria group bacterium]